MNDEALSTISAIAINALIFTGMAFASMGGGYEKPPEEQVAWVEFNPVELPKLGEERPENLLPRITDVPEPPPPETDVASLSRQKKEQEELEKKKEEEKKKRELAEQKRRDEEKRKEDERRKQKEEEEEKKRRKKAMRDALNKLKDPRADEDNPDGFADGDRNGTSIDPNARRNKATYINRVAHAIRQQFEIPTVIPPDVRKKLVARVQFKFDTDGKLVGAPRLLGPSGNKLFDEAALRALNKFGPGTQIRFPVPPFSQPDLRKSVLANGLRMEMTGKDG